MYDHAFFLTENISNNAFSFERRAALHQTSPRLYVPALRTGSVEEVRVGDQVVFEDFDDEGKLQSCRGLEFFVRTEIQGVPAFIFDNHNHAFAFWHLARAEKIIQDGALLIHIDGHKDNRLPEKFLSADEAHDLRKVFAYTNTILNVGNFIPAGQQTGVIGDVLQITSEDALRSLGDALQKVPPKEVTFAEVVAGISLLLEKFRGNIILDLDLDFFAPELDYIPEKLKLDVLRALIPRVQLMTIATSPFFIEQERALHFLKVLADNTYADNRGGFHT